MKDLKPYEMTEEQFEKYDNDPCLAWREAQKKLLKYLNSIYGTPAFTTASVVCIPLFNWKQLLKDFGIS